MNVSMTAISKSAINKAAIEQPQAIPAACLPAHRSTRSVVGILGCQISTATTHLAVRQEVAAVLAIRACIVVA
jgi:hypothetical protein